MSKWGDARVAFNDGISIEDTFTTKDICDLSGRDRNAVSPFISTLLDKGCCSTTTKGTGVGGSKIYTKIKNDDTDSTNRVPKTATKEEGSIYTTATALAESVVALVGGLKEEVARLTEDRLEILEENKTLRGKVDRYIQLIPTLKEEIVTLKRANSEGKNITI